MSPHQYADAAIEHSPSLTSPSDITAAFIAKIKRRMMRLRAATKKPGTLEEKLAAQAKASAAELELNRVRRWTFDIEDEVAKAIKA